MLGGRRKDAEIRRDSFKVTISEPDIRNKVTRCGIKNAPMLTVIVGPYMDNGDFKNDTCRVNMFLHLLRERGFDLNVLHLFDPAGNRPTPHDSENGYTGFLQHLRHVHNLPTLALNMVREVHAAFRQCISQPNGTGADPGVDMADAKDGASGSDQSCSFALDQDETSLERDTHNKIFRCGKENAALLTVYVCPYKNHDTEHSDLRRLALFIRGLILRCYDLHIIHIPADIHNRHSKSCHDSIRVEAIVPQDDSEAKNSHKEEIFYSADAQSTRNVHLMTVSLAEEMAREVDAGFKSMIRRHGKGTHHDESHEDSKHSERKNQTSSVSSHRSPQEEHTFLHHDEPSILRELEHHRMEPITHNQLMRTSSQGGAPELTVVLGPYRSGVKIHHDTLRVTRFLRMLLQHGFDLHIQHDQQHRVSLNTENHGFVEVSFGKRLLMYHHDAQHTRNLSRIDLISKEMLDEVLDMYQYYREESDKASAADQSEEGECKGAEEEEEGQKRYLKHTFSSL